MAHPPRDDAREQRIETEIIVDCYGPEEQAVGWYTYLEEHLGFPFRARCVAERAISPLRRGEAVEVVGMGPQDECGHEMFVRTGWHGRALAVPLAQLAGLDVDDETEQAIEDWRYWIGQGYES